jgi:hypothetical protein
MARRRSRHGPTDADLDAADLAGTTTVTGEYDYDTPTVDEIQQAETGFPDKPIPVEIEGAVRVEQLPTRIGSTRNWGLSSVAFPSGVKILNEDPRRARLVLLCAGGNVSIARSQSEVLDSGTRFLLGIGQSLEAFFVDELWAVGADAAARLSVLVEQWAR